MLVKDEVVVLPRHRQHGGHPNSFAAVTSSNQIDREIHEHRVLGADVKHGRPQSIVFVVILLNSILLKQLRRIACAELRGNPNLLCDTSPIASGPDALRRTPKTANDLVIALLD